MRMIKRFLLLWAMMLLVCLLFSSCQSNTQDAANTAAPTTAPTTDLTTDLTVNPADVPTATPTVDPAATLPVPPSATAEPPRVVKVDPLSFELEAAIKNNYENENEYVNEYENVNEYEYEYEYEYVAFDLRNSVYKAQSGRDMPYKVRGIMGVPIGAGPFPVVFITHGSHENLDETKRFDTGYEYLVRALAQNGYIAVSIDMSAPYIWRYGEGDDAEKSAAVAQEHIKSILLANNGEALYPIDLAGKVDTESIALIGHSRGGEAIFRIAEEQRGNGVAIDTLLSIAPSWDTMRTFPDVSTAIIVPQYDGDVARLDGIALYDYLVSNTYGDHSITFLMGANHNFFNRNIVRDDGAAHRIKNGYTPLLREEQEDFLINFTVDYLNASFGTADRFYQLSQLQPNKMYGHAVSRRIHLRNTAALIDMETANAFSSDGANVNQVVDSWFYKEDDILIDTVTIALVDEDLNRTNLNRNLISIEWDNVGTSVEIIPLIADFSDGVSLGIDLVPDAASELNATDRATDRALQFTIMLKDADGNAAAVTIPAEQYVLSPYPGELSKTELIDFTIEFWSPPTPPGALNIPLALFAGVDLSAIETITIIFDHDSSGAIFISSMQLHR